MWIKGLVLISALFLAACSSKPKVWAPDDQVAAARAVMGPPAEVILFTSVNAHTGAGAHSGLVINGSQRVLFDPAGTFEWPPAPERHDLIYGMTAQGLEVYRDFHVRPTHNLVEQHLTVPLAVADDLIARAARRGPVPDALCATSITELLSQTPGFEGLKGSMFPLKLRDGFAALPGVRQTTWTQESFHPAHGVLFLDEKPAQAVPTN